MAQIDPSIALNVKPLQLESPVNQMMAIAQLRGAQQQQQMNALKLQEYQQQEKERNALAQTISRSDFDLNNAAHVQDLLRQAPTLGVPYVKEARMAAAEKAKADKEAVQAEHERFKMRKEQLDFTNAALQKSTNPMIARAQIQQAIDLKYVTPEVGAQMLTSVPEDSTEFEAWRSNLLSQSMTAKDQLELIAPKPEKIDLNGVIRYIDLNPRSPTYGKEVLPEMAKTAAPAAESDLARLQRERAAIAKENSADSRLAQYDAAITKLTASSTESDLARLQRERADIAKANADDPRLKQYDAAIAKATATNQPLSDLARKQNELAELEEQLKADPNNKLLQQRIKEYRDDIRKDTTRPVTNVSVAAPITPVTIVDPNDPSKTIVVDGRTGKVIGQGVKEPSGVQLSSKEKQTREAKYPQATAAIKTYESKSETLAKDLEKLANHPGLSGISGVLFGRTPSGTKDSMAAQALYDSIIARGGFKELQDMRAASPTGGALGNVSNQEGQYLRDAFAPISRTQATEDLAAALKNAAGAVRDSKGRIREAYDMTYEYRGGGEAAPKSPAAKSELRSKADAILGK